MSGDGRGQITAANFNGWRVVETIISASILAIGARIVSAQDDALDAMEANLVIMRGVDAKLEQQQAILTTLVAVNSEQIREIRSDVKAIGR